ncbi:MAG TPA: DUF3429 domain-containing protein [Wenzhouxiangella sp.]|nr:DUF3429 domain-containing protein [Wenzhouxiangella sp.]
MRNRQQTARLLGWAGVLPFAAWTLVAWTGAPVWLVELLVGYGVLILAFMGGTLWSAALDQPQEPEAPLIASIVLVLAALPAFLLPAISAAALLAVLFALHWTAEYLWLRQTQPGWYRRMRLGITAAVVTLLVLAVLIELGQ